MRCAYVACPSRIPAKNPVFICVCDDCNDDRDLRRLCAYAHRCDLYVVVEPLWAVAAAHPFFFGNRFYPGTKLDRKIRAQPAVEFTRSQAERQQEKLKRLLGMLGSALIGLIILGLIGLNIIDDGDKAYKAAVDLLLGVSTLILLISAINQALQDYMLYLRKRSSPTVEEVLASGNPPVLYLRSFADDTVTGEPQAALLTEEEEIAKAFQPFGPMIAIGRPGERLPDLGAARAYFTDETWQAAIHHYMEIANLVVIRAGESEGLLWEIKNSIQRIDPVHFVLLIPFEKEAYNRFRGLVQPIFPKPLPDHPGHAEHKITTSRDPNSGEQRKYESKYGSILGLIHFDSDWTAHFERLTMQDVKRSEVLGGMVVDFMLYNALAPVYQKLGIPHDFYADPARRELQKTYQSWQDRWQRRSPRQRRLIQGAVGCSIFLITICYWLVFRIDWR